MAETTDKKRLIAYWVLTGIISLALTVSGIANLMHAQGLVDTIVTELGYPEYVLTILGPAKLLAAGILAAPKLPRLKEWAYAGIAIDMVAAFASHAMVAPKPGMIAPLVILSLALGSWYLRPESRRLGTVGAG